MKRFSTLFFSQKNVAQMIPQDQNPEPPKLFPLTQRICFSSIVFDSHPLIWQFDKSKKILICTFEVAGSSIRYEKNKLLDYLKRIDGVIVSKENQSAIINDVDHFRMVHHAMNIAEPVDRPTKAEDTYPEPKVKPPEKKSADQTISEIYFPQISFSGYPFTWFYYTNHDLAIWTSKLHGLPKHTYNSDTLLKKLQTIPGINIENEEAVIQHASDFCLRHQMKRTSDENEDAFSLRF